MNESYANLFKMIPSETPPKRLFERISGKVGRRELLRLRLISAFHGLFVCIGAMGIVAAISYWTKAVTYTGFYQYLSIITSGGSDLLGHWREMLLSFMDSLPLTETMLMIAAIIIFVESFRRVMGDVSTMTARRHHAQMQTA